MKNKSKVPKIFHLYNNMKSIAFLFLLVPSFGWSQNLVPNPSFEEYENCDNSNVITAMEFVVDWFNPNAWSSDYFKDYELPCVVNTNGPTNTEYLAPSPFDGNSFVGSYYYLFQNEKFEGIKEYIEVQLIQPLISGQTYEVSWWVSMAAKSKYKVNSMGAYFSSSALDDQFELLAFDVVPQAVVSEFLGDPGTWIQIKDTIWAAGGEQFITIGNFTLDDDLGLEQIAWGDNLFEGAYYTIDLVEVKSITVGLTELTPIDALPKAHYQPGSEQITLSNKKQVDAIWLVYNSSGQMLQQLVTNNKEAFINCSNYTNGLYFLKCVVNNQTSSTKILISKK
jgi:hypothetical protein